MTLPFHDLAAFGWSNHFQSQLSLEELSNTRPARVVAVHRDAIEVAGSQLESRIPAPRFEDDEGRPTVGDWLLLDVESNRPLRVLDRRSLFKRKAAGTARRVQLIAANVDTLLIVTSCNQDFNVARLERYLALARDSGASPIVVLTKADLVDDPAPYVATAAKLMPGLLVECFDARGPEAAKQLHPWCGLGQTLALVGSSGVGKSTLVNSLSGTEMQETAPIREDDSHGRHTTTGRSLHRLPGGAWLLDTPGMRELQLTDAGEGIEDVFADIVTLARECRFADCTHRGEPGCALQRAVEEGNLDADRLRRFQKLVAEDARNSEALHERHARERVFGRMVKSIMKEKNGRWQR